MDYETSEAIKGLLGSCLPAVALIIICGQAILGLVLLPIPLNWVWYVGTIIGTGGFTYWKTKDRLPKGTTLNEMKWLPTSELDERLSEVLKAKAERTRV